MFRRLLTGAAGVLGAGVVAADRALAAVAAHRIADRIRTPEGLAQVPAVRIEGFSFLAQVLRGRYRDMRVTLDQLRSGAVVLSEVEVHLRGVHLPLLAALRADADRVPVDAAQASVLLRWADASAVLGERVWLSEENGHVRVRGSVVAFGSSLAGSAVGEVRLDGDLLRIVPHEVSVHVGPKTLAVGPAAAAALSSSVPLALPFGLRLSGVRVEPAGLRITARGEGLVLDGGRRRLAPARKGP